jgi:hypothetical protein
LAPVTTRRGVAEGVPLCLLVFVALIDTRPHFDPEPEPEPRRRRRIRVPWKALLLLAIFLGLFKLSSLIGGLGGYAVLLTAVTILSMAVERSMGYRAGLTEHRL